jgi:hypothetical protein
LGENFAGNSFDKPRRIFIDSEYRLFCKDSNYEKSPVEKTDLLLLLLRMRSRSATAEVWRDENLKVKR